MITKWVCENILGFFGVFFKSSSILHNVDVPCAMSSQGHLVRLKCLRTRVRACVRKLEK